MFALAFLANYCAQCLLRASMIGCVYDKAMLPDGTCTVTDCLCAGNLLVKKALEGVRVCMLVWDDKSSVNSMLTSGSGMLMTHDEDTRRFFANTGVSFQMSVVLDPSMQWSCTHNHT